MSQVCPHWQVRRLTSCSALSHSHFTHRRSGAPCAHIHNLSLFHGQSLFLTFLHVIASSLTLVDRLTVHNTHCTIIYHLYIICTRRKFTRLSAHRCTASQASATSSILGVECSTGAYPFVAEYQSFRCLVGAYSYTACTAVRMLA